MLILLSCAKTMAQASPINVPAATVPQFAGKSAEIALQMSQFPVEDLKRLLNVNLKIARQNYQRFQDFHSEDNLPLPAILAYTGIVFKRLKPKDFTEEDFLYAQDHLRLTSFCYGLLRPLDLIKNYRIEGDIRLPEYGSMTLFDYWKPLLTDVFISTIKAQGNLLINLASNEMKQLFDWKKVEREVRIVTPEFQVERNGKLTTIVIYTKMCRGEMTRYLLKNRFSTPENLKNFTFEGFAFRPELSDENNYKFTIRE
ncbi:peroxide stress protein YaaA [Parabacteroides pacaensis]|uniref:peroxide stress protein YaaA n=1 Tax=Parabacteroides pacaensis TaxID=2086575 RepID=UPI000D0E982B|nr:peroxide stress protein YaaA [Parabacteroides pacaensis]